MKRITLLTLPGKLQLYGLVVLLLRRKSPGLPHSHKSELATCTLYKRKKKLTDAKSPADSADSGFASFSKKKLTGAKS